MNAQPLLVASVVLLSLQRAAPAWAQSPSPSAPAMATATTTCTPRTSADTATIEGSFYRPVGVRLPVQVVAIRQEAPGSCAYFVTIARGDRFAVRGLPPGRYVLVGYALDAAGRTRAGGFTDSVACMATCGHSGNCCRGAHHVSIVITLRPGVRMRHIHIADWEATLPPRPAGVP